MAIYGNRKLRTYPDNNITTYYEFFAMWQNVYNHITGIWLDSFDNDIFEIQKQQVTDIHCIKYSGDIYRLTHRNKQNLFGASYFECTEDQLIPVLIEETDKIELKQVKDLGYDDKIFTVDRQGILVTKMAKIETYKVWNYDVHTLQLSGNGLYLDEESKLIIHT